MRGWADPEYEGGEFVRLQQRLEFISVDEKEPLTFLLVSTST